MLQVKIPESEMFDELNQEFISINPIILQLEHSLYSLSKWESKWCKPFLGKDKKTTEETIDYVRCMTLHPEEIMPEVYSNIPDSVYREIMDYINAPMTATWFNEDPGSKKPSREVITAEIIYYGMIVHNIPWECQYWHLNRLTTLIKVCNIKNNPPKKMGRKEMLARRKALNDARRSQLNSRG